MKSLTLKLIPKLVALALSSSLIFACASQDGTEQKQKKVTVTAPASAVESPQPSASTTAEIIQPVESANPVAQINSESADVNIPASHTVITEPEQRIFYFGFDKIEITQGDVGALKDHADFLKKHSEVVVAIDGHTDYHGPHSYNEHLSKKRAESVAKILIGEGVPESQLQINALAESKPLECKRDTVHNRRVELHYQDGNLASSK
jgi:peptidoglycan-associated lipoprotein